MFGQKYQRAALRGSLGPHVLHGQHRFRAFRDGTVHFIKPTTLCSHRLTRHILLQAHCTTPALLLVKCNIDNNLRNVWCDLK